MVTFIPPYMGEEIKSNAEKKMYGSLSESEAVTKHFYGHMKKMEIFVSM